MEIRNNLVVYRGPRNTFDKKGFFINPKIILKEKFNQLQDYERSLNESVSFFIKMYDRKNKFNAKINKLSLLSNKILLKNNFKIK